MTKISRGLIRNRLNFSAVKLEVKGCLQKSQILMKKVKSLINMNYAVLEKWSLFKEKVLNKDFLKKMANNGPYLVLSFSKSPYFSKCLEVENIFCQSFCLDE